MYEVCKMKEYLKYRPDSDMIINFHSVRESVMNET